MVIPRLTHNNIIIRTKWDSTSKILRHHEHLLISIIKHDIYPVKPSKIQSLESDTGVAAEVPKLKYELTAAMSHENGH